MLYYDKNYIREGIDVAKSNNIKECIICQFGFCNHVFNFQVSVCNGFHDFMILRLDITIITVEGFGYCCIIHDIIKSEAIYLLENYVLEVRGYI